MPTNNQIYKLYCPTQYQAGDEIKTWWTEIGAAFPSKKDPSSFNLYLNALPVPNPKDGRVLIHMRLPHKEEDAQGQAASEGSSFPYNPDSDDI